MSIPREGDYAPNFAAPTDAGVELSLDSLRGQTVVLFFYPKDGTGG